MIATDIKTVLNISSKDFFKTFFFFFFFFYKIALFSDYSNSVTRWHKIVSPVNMKILLNFTVVFLDCFVSFLLSSFFLFLFFSLSFFRSIYPECFYLKKKIIRKKEVEALCLHKGVPNIHVAQFWKLQVLGHF